VPRIGMRPTRGAGALVEILPDPVGRPLPVSLLHPHARHVPKRVRVMLAWLAQVMEPHLAAAR
ncbi:MAG TPA: LysR family transcriptional regulator, partial [Polyangiaceae bacterium]